MNNKGFTLVELLAVLVVLTTILMIAIPSITSSLERNKEKIKEKKIDIIEDAGYEYFNKYKNNISNYNDFVTGNCCINIEVIKDAGLLSNEDLYDVDENSISGYICCKNKDILVDKTPINKFICEYKEAGANEC